MATAQAKKFVANLPPEDTELDICPPSCREDHDEKWHGVTVPVPKKVKVEKKVPTPEIFRHTPPKDTVVWDDPYPSLLGKEWKTAMKRDGKSPWKHYEYPVQGKIVPMEPPTRKQLEKHARLYSRNSPATLASVHEVAAMYGLSGLHVAKPPPPKRGPRGMNTEEKARQLVNLGHDWEVIEDELNLSRPKSIELHEMIFGEAP